MCREKEADMGKMIMYEKIYSDLLNKIKIREYGPGAKLPSEKELAEEYGVSRITSKKAMDLLMEKHYIVRSPGRGSFVSESIDELLPFSEMEEQAKAESAVKQDGKEKVLIGVIFDAFGYSFGGKLLKGIEGECRQLGFDMVFKCTDGVVEEENRAIEDALRAGAKGLILMCAQGEIYNNQILRLALNHFPMVLADRQMKGISIPCVKTDNYTAAKELTRRLIEKGHRKICFVSHSFTATPTITERYNGFVDCIFEHEGVKGTTEWLQGYNPMYDSGEEEFVEEELDEVREVASKNLDHTAFFVAEFNVGILLRCALREMDQEREIATFDGFPEIYEVGQEFMRVKQEETLMGRTAVRTLKDVMSGKDVEDIIYTPYEIIQHC